MEIGLKAGCSRLCRPLQCTNIEKTGMKGSLTLGPEPHCLRSKRADDAHGAVQRQAGASARGCFFLRTTKKPFDDTWKRSVDHLLIREI